jgi:hypothetical protein
MAAHLAWLRQGNAMAQSSKRVRTQSSSYQASANSTDQSASCLPFVTTASEPTQTQQTSNLNTCSLSAAIRNISSAMQQLNSVRQALRGLCFWNNCFAGVGSRAGDDATNLQEVCRLLPPKL